MATIVERTCETCIICSDTKMDYFALVDDVFSPYVYACLPCILEHYGVEVLGLSDQLAKCQVHDPIVETMLYRIWSSSCRVEASNAFYKIAPDTTDCREEALQKALLCFRRAPSLPLLYMFRTDFQTHGVYLIVSGQEEQPPIFCGDYGMVCSYVIGAKWIFKNLGAKPLDIFRHGRVSLYSSRFAHCRYVFSFDCIVKDGPKCSLYMVLTHEGQREAFLSGASTVLNMLGCPKGYIRCHIL